MLQCFKERKKTIAQTEESFYLENGGLMLEQLITSFDGKYNSFKIFSKQELKKATNDYHVDGILYKSFHYIVYRGIHDGREISIKKFMSSSFQTYKTCCINEVAVVSQMNNHNNVVKFFGCCLETEIPMLVYEFVENENLSDHIFDDRRLLSWENRLRIVTEVAHAIAYVHMGRPKTIVHRDIESRNIFLDHNYVAKISEFGFSLPIPSDKKYVDAEVVGAVGFISPESHNTGRYTEKSDVYSFGAILFEANLLDGGNRKQQIECAELAQRCLKMNSDERPTMKDVTQSPREIKRLLNTPT